MEKIIDAEFEEIKETEEQEITRSFFRDAIVFMAWLCLVFITGAIFCMGSFLL